MKIRHWIPAYNDTLNAGVTRQLQIDAFAAADAGHYRSYSTEHSCLLHVIRNRIMHEAIEGGFDVVWMQDADNYSPQDNSPFMQLTQSMQDADAVAAFAAIPLRNMGGINVFPFKTGTVHEIEKGGSGMVAIDLRKIRPWYHEYPGPLFVPICTDPKQHTVEMGMDIFFSRLMRGEMPGIKPRLKIIADSRIPTVHVNAMHKMSFNGLTGPISPVESHEAATRLISPGAATCSNAPEGARSNHADPT